MYSDTVNNISVYLVGLFNNWPIFIKQRRVRHSLILLPNIIKVIISEEKCRILKRGDETTKSAWK
jgi:hypothetical protein